MPHDTIPPDAFRADLPADESPSGEITTRAEFLRFFWLVALSLAGFGLVTILDRPATYTVAGFAVLVCALLPAYLWCRLEIPGLPIFPLFCANYALTYALPLLLSHEDLADHSEDAIWRAALTVCGFLLIATAPWVFWNTRRLRRPAHIWVFEETSGNRLLLMALVASIVVTILVYADWLPLPTGLRTTVVQGLLGLNMLSTFVLGFRWGGSQLPDSIRFAFLCSVVIYCYINVCTLFLVGGFMAFMTMLLGYALGRGQVPWRVLIVFGCVVAFLHIGKADMRAKYWREGEQGHIVKPTDYLPIMVDWVRTSLTTIAYREQSAEKGRSILQRASTIELLLQAQALTPELYPYLHGATYSIIPSAMVPRLFSPDKASPHDSNVMLNIYYGNQTWRSAQYTTIGWGLLNEGYANFGFAGCAGLAIICGSLLGCLARWSAGFPVLSFRSLIGMMTMPFAIQTEWTASIFLSSYVQALVPLLALSFLFMRPYDLSSTPVEQEA